MAQAEERSFSIIDQMHKRLATLADERMNRLSDNDLKALIPWLENRQVELQVEVATEDDPLRAAKWRGAIEELTNLSGEVLERIQKRAVAAAKAAQGEKEEDDDE